MRLAQAYGPNNEHSNNGTHNQPTEKTWNYRDRRYAHVPSQKIKDYFGNGSNFGVNITYFTEDTPLGTAGSVKTPKISSMKPL